MVCFLCGREGHVSASCPQRPRLFDRVIAVVALLFIAAGYAWGHDANLYDDFCCGGGDCAPVSHVTYVAANSASLPRMVVTTSLGTMVVDDKTIWRDSKDNRLHACLHQGRVWCVYLPNSQ